MVSNTVGLKVEVSKIVDQDVNVFDSLKVLSKVNSKDYTKTDIILGLANNQEEIDTVST